MSLVFYYPNKVGNHCSKVCSLVLNHPETDVQLRAELRSKSILLDSRMQHYADILFLVPLFQVHVSTSIFTQTSSSWLSVIPLTLLLQYFFYHGTFILRLLSQRLYLRPHAHWNLLPHALFALLNTQEHNHLEIKILSFSILEISGC